MRQELIDLLLGELEPAEADALKARLRAEPDLRRELSEIESLFGLMRRGEEIAPLAATREAVVAAAARVRPPVLVRLRALPGLVAYRFQQSRRFRIAMISLCAHLVVIAVLAQVLLRPGDSPTTVDGVTLGVLAADSEPIAPARLFQMRLWARQNPQSNRLRQVGVPRQEEAIATGLETLLASQHEDGSFGDAPDTAYAALALLAKGDCSKQQTPRGRAIRLACNRLLAESERGTAHGAMLAALVEDFALSYDGLNEFERQEYRIAIRKLTLSVPDDDISREGLLLARLAGFSLPAGRDLGEAGLALSGNRTGLLAMEPTRLRATVAFARGSRVALDPDQTRAWAAPLFERAMADLKAGKTSALALLTLQSPYRL